MDPTTNHDTPTPSTVMYDPTVGTRGFPSVCASLRWLILAFGWSCALPSASGVEALAPSDDPVRGDALVAAVHARDAVRLKGLLRSADRERGATYTTTASAKHGQHMAIDDLFNDAKDGPCLIALLDYGVDIGGAKLGMFADLKPFKDHYPAFLTTAGRSGMDHAAKIGDNALLEKLLALGVAPKESDLAAAVSCSHAGAVKRLLAAGVAKDGTAEFMGKRMTIEEIAVQGMFFGVLDELGAWDRHAAELKLHRAGRPGPGAAKLVGKWRAGDLVFWLEPDGSGFIGNTMERLLPALWKVVEQSGRIGLRIEPVPGTTPTGKREFPAMWVPVAGEKISYQGKNGLVEWTRMDMSSDQRQAYLAACQPEKYAGPVGEWAIQIEACQFPPEMPAKERDQVKDGKLSIAADGNATMTFLGDAARMRAVQGDNNELKLVPEKRPPFVCTGSNDWKTIRLTFPPPGDRVTLVFVKAAK